MSPQTTSIVVAAICAVTCLGFWIWLVALPVAQAFDGGLRRTIAVVLTGYSLLVGLAAGAALGAVVFYNWDTLAQYMP